MLTSHRLAEVLARVLGLPPETVRQHLRNLQAPDDRRLISAKGRGRGAAAMTPLDAARLLLAAVGADFVKDSVAALDAFGDLQPIGRRDPSGATALVSQLAALLTRLASELDEEPAGGRVSNLGLSLMSVASVDPAGYPRVAILRWGRTGSGAVSFATAGWDQPVISVADYAARMEHAGLIRERHVTRSAMERIARAL